MSYFKQNLQTKKAAQIVINRRLTGQGAQNFPDVFNQIVNPELKSKDEAMEVEEENAENQNADDERKKSIQSPGPSSAWGSAAGKDSEQLSSKAGMMQSPFNPFMVTQNSMMNPFMMSMSPMNNMANSMMQSPINPFMMNNMMMQSAAASSMMQSAAASSMMPSINPFMMNNMMMQSAAASSMMNNQTPFMNTFSDYRNPAPAMTRRSKFRNDVMFEDDDDQDEGQSFYRIKKKPSYKRGVLKEITNTADVADVKKKKDSKTKKVPPLVLKLTGVHGNIKNPEDDDDDDDSDD